MKTGMLSELSATLAEILKEKGDMEVYVLMPGFGEFGTIGKITTEEIKVDEEESKESLVIVLD